MLIWGLGNAGLFAVLLNFKHINIYYALPYFVFLLGGCWKQQQQAFSVGRFISLGAVTAAVFAASLGPFVHAGGVTQLLQVHDPLAAAAVCSPFDGSCWDECPGRVSFASSNPFFECMSSTPCSKAEPPSVGGAD